MKTSKFAGDPQLQELDVALTRLRRLWDSPSTRRWLMARLGRFVEPGVIRVLRVVHEPRADLGVGDIAQTLGVDDSTASRYVAQAVGMGLVQRYSSPKDRRRRVVALTDAGAELLVRATGVRAEFLARLIDGWDNSDVETMARLLARLADSLMELENDQ